MESLTVKLCPAHTQDDPASPHEQSSEEDMDSCSVDGDLKEPVDDSDTESGGSSDNPSDWAPLYRPHFSHHSNLPPLKAPLSETQRSSRQDRGEEERDVVQRNVICLIMYNCHGHYYVLIVLGAVRG